jgi:hypothetical protein
LDFNPLILVTLEIDSNPAINIVLWVLKRLY